MIGHKFCSSFKHAAAPRSYIVNVNGTNYRRNRRHILPVAEPAPKQTTDNDIFLNPTDTPQPAAQIPGLDPANFAPPRQVVTRSGRISKPNSRYRDYAT